MLQHWGVDCRCDDGTTPVTITQRLLHALCCRQCVLKDDNHTDAVIRHGVRPGSILGIKSIHLGERESSTRHSPVLACITDTATCLLSLHVAGAP